MTRIIGKICLWLGVIIAVLVVGGFGLGTLSAYSAQSEAFGWLIAFGFILGIPALIIAVFLLLIGVVLLTISPYPSPAAPPMPEPAMAGLNASRALRLAQPVDVPDTFRDPLRSAVLGGQTARPSSFKLVAFFVRALALVLFAMLFVPDMYQMYKYRAFIPEGAIATTSTLIVVKFVKAAIIPLVLLLVANLLIKRDATPAGAAT